VGSLSIDERLVGAPFSKIAHWNLKVFAVEQGDFLTTENSFNAVEGYATIEDAPAMLTEGIFSSKDTVTKAVATPCKPKILDSDNEIVQFQGFSNDEGIEIKLLIFRALNFDRCFCSD
jgi:hypothetical protein